MIDRDEKEKGSVKTQSDASYLKELLGKHMGKVDRVANFTQSKQEQFKQQILSGRYEIRERQWTAEDGEGVVKKQANSKTGFTKRQLEEQLQLIQSQMQQSDVKTARVVTEEQRLAFLKKMEKQKKEVIRKREEAIRVEKQQRDQQQKQRKLQLKKQQVQRRQRRKSQAQQRLKLKQQTHKLKQQTLKTQQQQWKQRLKQKTTAQKMQQKFNLLQNTSLEQRKKKLAEIRTLHRPIDTKQLQSHAQKLEQLHQQRQLILKQKEQVKQITPTFYKSVFYQKVKQEQRTFLDRKQQQDLVKLRQVRDKLKKFSEHVRSNYKPEIDESKVEEMKFRNVKSRSMSSVPRGKPLDSAQKIGLRYLEFSKMQGDHQKLLGGESSQSEAKPLPKMDYLQQLREKNKNRPVQSVNDLMRRLDKDNLSWQQKQCKITEFTDRLEQKARRKQQLQRVGSLHPADAQLDALYLQAIQAKLNLLDDM